MSTNDFDLVDGGIIYWLVSAGVWSNWLVPILYMLKCFDYHSCSKYTCIK